MHFYSNGSQRLIGSLDCLLMLFPLAWDHWSNHPDCRTTHMTGLCGSARPETKRLMDND